MSVLERDEAPVHGHAEHPKESFWRRYVFSQDHKVIGLQYGFTALCFLLFGFTLMLLMRWQLAFPGRVDPGDRRPARRGQRARRHHAPRVLQPARRHARHDHGVPGDRAAGRGRVRQLRRAAPDRRARHGLPEAQHGELLVLLRGRHRDVRQLLRARRRRQLRLDLLSAALGHRHRGPDLVADRAWSSSSPRRSSARSTSSSRSSSSAPGACPSCACRSSSGRSSSPRSCSSSPSRRSRRRRSCSSWTAWRARASSCPGPGGQRPAAAERRRRQPAPLAAPVLVPGPPRGLRAHPAGHGHRRRGDRQQHPQAALGLQVDGLRGPLPRLHVVRGVGAPHVPDRHGHGDQRLLPDHHDDHLDAVGDHPDAVSSCRSGAARSASPRRCSSRSPSCRCSASAG